jgi:diadenosine tetraphosphate (Ap4A) HIT family hydrolase
MKKPDCRFCRANGLANDAPVAETAHHYVLASLDPEMLMAAMVIPNRHHDDPFSVTAEEWADFGAALAAAKAHLAQYRPDGFTIGWNVTRLAGQTVGHAHCHVIARHADEGAAGHGIRSLLKGGRAAPEMLPGPSQR